MTPEERQVLAAHEVDAYRKRVNAGTAESRDAFLAKHEHLRVPLEQLLGQSSADTASLEPFPARPSPVKDLAPILKAIEEGDGQAASDLLPIVYEELRRLATARLAQESSKQSLHPTELVHEAYLRLIGDQHPDWDGRGHFFAAAAEAMRRILIDRARARNSQKRGGDRGRVDLRASEISLREVPGEILALDDALNRLEAEDKVKAELVRLRFYAGMSLKAAAKLLGLSPSTADRYWSYARAWLYHELDEGDQADDS